MKLSKSQVHQAANILRLPPHLAKGGRVKNTIDWMLQGGDWEYKHHELAKWAVTVLISRTDPRSCEILSLLLDGIENYQQGGQ